MDIQLIIDAISRVTHVSTAIALVGGTSFVLFVLIPCTHAVSEADRIEFQSAINARWKRFVGIGILLFIVSGFYNFIRAVPNHRGDGLYHALLGVKILLALALFIIAAALVGRSQPLEFIRKQRVIWLRVFVSIAFVIVAISGFVKVRGLPPKPTSVNSAPEVVNASGNPGR